MSRRHWVHNGWELLVQQRQNTDVRWETDFVTSSQNGEPQAVFNPQGELRWRAPKSTLWGQRQSHLEENIDPGLGFAGQYRDTESGLCYNRFRYYNSAGGCYVSPDPIGIAGGESNYGYVHNPVSWVDPFGLAGCSKELAQRKAQELRDSATSNTQRSKLPRATSAVVDKATGKVYYGFSGRPLPNSIHPHLAERMPSPSLERWPVQNCAEFKGVNQALLDGARLENLEVHTVKTISGEAFPMCSNCQTTIFGTIVTSG